MQRLESVTAVVAAGGRGTRFSEKGDLPKQYLSLAGQPVFMHSVATLAAHSGINKLMIVAGEEMHARVKAELRIYLPGRVDDILLAKGGATRQESVCAALEQLATLSQPPKYVLIHDAARPFVSKEDIDRLIEALHKHKFCTLAIPVSDTIKRVKKDQIIETIDRSELYAMQTPQAADFQTILDAHRQAKKDGFETTDDVALLERQKISVIVVPGNTTNFKITNQHDMWLAQALATHKSDNLGADS
jgi:2-C-methyl-D-erythritol 4-phosphate cytidylyltransferase